MISYSKVISTVVQQGRRLVKVLRSGRNDVRECPEAKPFGIDSNPTKDLTAIFAQTGQSGKAAIIGYIGVENEAATGETRIYSVNGLGQVVAQVFLKSDGTIKHITNGNIELGGALFTAVRHAPLNAALQAEVAQINANLAAIQTAITTLGGVYVPTPVIIDITAAESAQIKLK